MRCFLHLQGGRGGSARHRTALLAGRFACGTTGRIPRMAGRQVDVGLWRLHLSLSPCIFIQWCSGAGCFHVCDDERRGNLSLPERRGGRKVILRDWEEFVRMFLRFRGIGGCGYASGCGGGAGSPEVRVAGEGVGGARRGLVVSSYSYARRSGCFGRFTEQSREGSTCELGFIIFTLLGGGDGGVVFRGL